jgi:hypothetical protein
MPVEYVMLFLKKALIHLPHDITGQNVQRNGIKRDLRQIGFGVLAQKPENNKDQDNMPCLAQKPDHFIPWGMVQYTVIRIQYNDHDQIYQNCFQDHPPEKAGCQYPFFFDKEESCQKT